MSKLDTVLDAVMFLTVEFRILRVISRLKSRISTMNLRGVVFGLF